ncbi:MAG: VCBS repeat-containing protein [Myxococcota bacterium]
MRGFELGTVTVGLLAFAWVSNACRMANDPMVDSGSMPVVATGCVATKAPRFVDRTDDQLPELTRFCMDAQPFDADGDGDLDLFLAQEFVENVLLINDGTGTFTDVSDARLPRARRDSEDIAIIDFNGDEHSDVFIVSEDDRTNELYLNDGTGTFTDDSASIPVEGRSNGVVAIPLDDDATPDLVIGNAGLNTALLSALPLVDVTTQRLPDQTDTTQDLEAGDVDGDGDFDLIVANESDNVLWRNDGTGTFTAEPSAIALRASPEETREAELGDVDGDGDLDLVFANIQVFVAQADRANRLLINDGTGQFTDAPDGALPSDNDDTFDVELFDLDADGDLDLVTANLDQLSGGGGERYRVYENDGQGMFTEATNTFFDRSVRGNGFDIEVADFSGDGRPDLYLCSRGGQDRLLIAQP